MCQHSSVRAPHALSIAKAMPIPPLTHSVARPSRDPRRIISYSSVTTMRVPVAPIGCPRAMAPPLTSPSPSDRDRQVAQDGEHLGRERFIQLDEFEILGGVDYWVGSTSFFTAGTGPIPMIRGSTPALAHPTIRASGFTPSAFALSAFIRTNRGATVRDPRRGSSRNDAALTGNVAKDDRQLGQALDRRPRAWMFILREVGRVFRREPPDGESEDPPYLIAEPVQFRRGTFPAPSRVPRAADFRAHTGRTARA